MLAHCLLPFLISQAPEAAKPAEAPPEAPKAYAHLDTMSRMLQKRIEEKREELLGARDAANARASRLGTVGQGADSGSVTNDLLRYAWSTPSVTTSNSDYVPGLAAIFSLRVPVRTEWVEEEKQGETETPKPASRSDDDEAWDEVARPTVNTSLAQGLSTWRGSRNLELAAKGGRKSRLSPAAVDALKKTVLDTIWRFGARLELERGERLAVVVEVQGAGRPGAALHGDNRTREGVGSADDGWSASDDGAPGGGGASELPGFGVLNGGSLALGDYVSGTTAPGLRIVIQVAAEDLKAYRDGELDREDLPKKTRLRSFPIAASTPNYYREYGLAK
jgi:hypothetical protein